MDEGKGTGGMVRDKWYEKGGTGKGGTEGEDYGRSGTGGVVQGGVVREGVRREVVRGRMGGEYEKDGMGRYGRRVQERWYGRDGTGRGDKR